MIEFGIFAFVTSITPGPNNSMLMASGIRFGRKKSLPHFFGIWLGFNFLFFLGGNLLSYVPDIVFEYLQYACLLYTSPSPRDRTRSRMPSSA